MAIGKLFRVIGVALGVIGILFGFVSLSYWFTFWTWGQDSYAGAQAVTYTIVLVVFLALAFGSFKVEETLS